MGEDKKKEIKPIDYKQQVISMNIYKLWESVTERNISRDKDYPFGLGKEWELKI